MRGVFAQEGDFFPQFKEFANLVLFFLLIVVLGFPIATVIFITTFIGLRSRRHIPLAFGLAIALLSIMWVLASLLTLQYPSGWIATVVDLPWWLSGY